MRGKMRRGLDLAGHLQSMGHAQHTQQPVPLPCVRDFASLLPLNVDLNTCPFSPCLLSSPTPSHPPHPATPQVERVAQRLASSKKMRLVLTDAAVEFLAQQGFEPMYGARPVKRAVTQYLETPIARAILAEEFVPEDTIEVDVDDEAGGSRLVLRKGARASQASIDASGYAVARS